MQAGPDTGSNTDTGYVNNSPRLDFNVDFVKTGTHYIWIRGYKTDGTDDSCHIGLDGQAVSSADRIARWADINQWLWSSTTRDGDSRATFNAGSKGVHTVNVWMREDGFRIDKIVLTTNPNYVPTSVGPVESQRPDIDNQPPIPIPDPIDTISITKAQYHLVNQELIVEATSTDQPQAELDLDGYGQMTWNAANNKYEYRVEGSGDPQDWVTVNSSLGGSTTVSVNYVDEVIADTVTVTKAEYNFVNQELTVEATSTDQPQAELDLDGYGQMTWNAANNKYEYRVEGSADPQDWITVNSSLGGFATVSVNYIDEVIVDTVTVTKAEYNLVNQELKVEATSTDQPQAVLDLDGYGQMTWNTGNNKYEYRVEGSSDPKDWVTVNSSLGGSTTVSVTYKDVVAAADVVTITKAEYKETEQELRVEATSSEQGEAELYLEGYGQMTWNPEKGKYEYRVKGRADPDGWVTVTSSLGGAATSSVYYRDAVDGIVIKKAEYKPGGGELIVQAYAVGQPDTELTVEGYGQMVWKADKSRYEYKNKPVSNPGDTITVAASNGNEVIVSVEYKY
jgi:DNA-binding sugar fermentation-stimulating protein